MGAYKSNLVIFVIKFRKLNIKNILVEPVGPHLVRTGWSVKTVGPVGHQTSRTGLTVGCTGPVGTQCVRTGWSSDYTNSLEETQLSASVPKLLRN